MYGIHSVFNRWRSLPQRTHVSIIIGALILLLLITLAIVFFVRTPHAIYLNEETRDLPAVTLTNAYENGAHAISGTITLRNRCQRLDAMAALDESITPPIIRVDLTSEYDEGICLEIPDTRPFTLSVPGSESARVEVFVNGIPQSGSAL